ncbi:Fanconi anemia group A protein isoform X2 [Ornithorhynchus anatinus]|uniref:Fanconi anemia group A protein isoform X2 n=1 Tax=Ornithorhynchus anatinus TaxID=9258 RepID=UPI0010A8213A|nr:Fanconi anemia group A protein isoform X2 [Ornithorhynchus anatinus]
MLNCRMVWKCTSRIIVSSSQSAYLPLEAGRASKNKCKSDRRQKLQEAAVYLLTRHQNLNDLLLEGENPPCKKSLCLSKLTDASSPDSLATPSKSLVVSALQEQASRLGVPVGILSARTAASSIEQICQASASSSQIALLSWEQRKLSALLETIQSLLVQNVFSRPLFCQELWKVQSSLVLEALWHLHTNNIVGLEELLDSHPDLKTLEMWLSSNLHLLCEQTEDSTEVTEVTRNMLSDFMGLLVQRGFQQASNLKRNKEQEKTSRVFVAVLQRMLTNVLDAVAVEEQDRSSSSKAVKCWLKVYCVSMYGNLISPDSLKRFFTHTLTQIFIYNPVLKASDAIRMQREWSFARTCPLLTMIYRGLFVVFTPKELVSHLQEVLETYEVNWQHILSCVSTLVVCLAEAQQLVKDWLARLMIKAFETYNLESMITAFLIVRQAAQEGPSVFISYTEWFKVSFGSVSGYHNSSKKALVFLCKFLSDIVPFEAPQYMKVHILHPPLVPAKYRSLLLDYITLAKTQLADLNVAIEDMGLYEDLSSPGEPLKPQCQALKDVEKAIKVFEQTGKIPALVLEASIFRRPYYTTRFLPALLTPRVLPEVPDSRMTFIDFLKRSDKIPANLYDSYHRACSTAEERQDEDAAVEMETDSADGPLDRLKAGLKDLRTLIVDPTKYDAMAAQIAVISEKLRIVLGHSESNTECETLRVHLNFHAPKLEQLEQRVTDLLLTSFCQYLIVSSSFNPPDRQGPWPSLFVKMMCGHKRLLPAVITRLCQLIYHQGPCLSDTHIIGLAALAVHLNESKSFFPELDTTFAKRLSVAEYWEHLLTCRTGLSLSFCLRFCTAAVSYSLCKFSSHPCDTLHSCVPPGFIRKLQFVVPRLLLEARGVNWQKDETNPPWRPLFCPSVNWKRAALCLWKHRRFQELSKEKGFLLTFKDWLLFELEVQPETDVLSDAERKDFHQWALYQRYVPESSAAGGCDGDTERACTLFVGTLVDFCQRSPLEKSELSLYDTGGNRDILSRLQEMVLELELEHKRTSGVVRPRGQGHFLFSVFKEKLQTGGDGLTVSEQLIRQREILVHKRIVLSLPPSVLIKCQGRQQVALDCEDFFHFVNTELRNICARGCTLTHDITAHFFRGLLSACLSCKDPALEVNSVLTTCQTECPIILISAVLWWPRLEPVLTCQWKRNSENPLPQKLQNLVVGQQSAWIFLSSNVVSPISDPVWIPAAFLYFAIHQQVAPERMASALKKLGKDREQLLVSLFFFSLMGLISSHLAPQEGGDFPKTLDMCSEILGCLERRRMSWLIFFQSPKKGTGLYQILLSAASDQYIRLLPLAFYSLSAFFDQELFTREEAFLYVATDMYLKLVQLFAGGETSAASTREPWKQVDSLGLIRKARLFLFRAIPRCPKRSFSNVTELLATCEDCDPEMKAALASGQQPPEDADLYGEPLLF